MTKIKYNIQSNYSFPYNNSSNFNIIDNKHNIGEYIYYYKPKRNVNVNINKYNKKINNEYKKRTFKNNKSICTIL